MTLTRTIGSPSGAEHGLLALLDRPVGQALATRKALLRCAIAHVPIPLAAPPLLDAAQQEELRAALQSTPPGGQALWTGRLVAAWMSE